MDRLEPLFIPQNSSPWREWQGLFLVPMYATGISFGMRINKVTVASQWHRGARLRWDLLTKIQHFHYQSALVHKVLWPASPTLLTLIQTERSTVRPIVTFLSALVNTQHSCRSTSSKALRNTKIPFHFPPKSYLTVWGSTFKNTRINSGLTQARTTHDDKEICNYNQRVNQAYLMFDRGRPVWIHISEERNLKHHRKEKKRNK